MAPSEPPFFAASAGGHLDLLTAVAPQVLAGHEVVWVTSRTPRGEALRTTEADVELVPEYGRNPVRAARNALAAFGILVRRRPRAVVTSGAGVVVPFCVLARLFGAHIVYIETMARVRGPSRTARLLSRLALVVIVQWPELQHELPRAVVCRPTLLEHVGEVEPEPGSGTFVAVGTHQQPHERMLGMIADALRAGVLPTPVHVQIGPADWSADGARVSRYIDRAELEEALSGAELVVCHGGAGIISSALNHGRTPIVIPRREALGEHVDDHQLELTRKLADWGLVVPVERAILAIDVKRASAPPRAPAELRERPTAAALLREALGGLV